MRTSLQDHIDSEPLKGHRHHLSGRLRRWHVQPSSAAVSTWPHCAHTGMLRRLHPTLMRHWPGLSGWCNVMRRWWRWSKTRLAQEDAQTTGWLLDGYPRSAEQAEAIEDAGIHPDVFILIDVSVG